MKQEELIEYYEMHPIKADNDNDDELEFEDE